MTVVSVAILTALALFINNRTQSENVWAIEQQYSSISQGGVGAALICDTPLLADEEMAVYGSRMMDDHGREYSPEMLRAIYLRLEDLFENEKPYLDSDLNIIKISKNLYTNKSYVSRALFMFAGKNFCQYVNDHRVRYSIELFESDDSLNVAEMALRSGFHTSATYNLAFRSKMHIPPGEWCRQRRIERGI